MMEFKATVEPDWTLHLTISDGGRCDLKLAETVEYGDDLNTMQCLRWAAMCPVGDLPRLMMAARLYIARRKAAN